MTGRPHGVYRKFKLSRIMLREQGMQGNVPGLKKKLVGKNSISCTLRA